MALLLFLVISQPNTDILVNDDTFGGIIQQYPAVARDDSGDYYCIWNDFRISDYNSETYLQRLSAFGSVHRPQHQSHRGTNPNATTYFTTMADAT